jgi:simple sugar transport system substrate-binding protein/ribose transport system substrate-binding protein
VNYERIQKKEENMMKRGIVLLVAVCLVLMGGSVQAKAVKLGIIGFQMSSETHARVVNAAEKKAKAKGWEVTVLNSRGSMPEHAAQLENLVQSGVDCIILAMGKVLQLESQLADAKAKGVSVVSVSAGTSPNTLFDVNVNEFEVGAKIAVYLLGRLNYQGKILVQRYEGHGGTRIRGKILDVVLSENKGVSVVGTHTMAKTKSWREDVKAGMESLILKYQGEFDAIWTSFDGQAFIIDDILQGMGMKKGDIILTGVDGGPEANRRIRDPKSLFTATVEIPFAEMGEAAVDALDKIVVRKMKKSDVVKGPFLFMSAKVVDETNVPAGQSAK